MDLKELKELNECNELDMLLRLIKKADNAKKRTEKMLGGNKSAGVDVRKIMQDIRLLSEIIRDEVQRRKSKTLKDSRLLKAIKLEEIRLAREETRIKKLEENRSKKLAENRN